MQRMSAYSRFNLCERKLCKSHEGSATHGGGTCPEIRGIDKDVVGYSMKWHLVGVYLRCVSCGESQRASDGIKPFSHYKSCPHKASEDQFPWYDLKKILSNLPEL
jgi:hypothetical protein